MSILTMCPSPSWYEDDFDADFDPDECPETPAEALSVESGRVWWTAAPTLDTDD